MIRQTEVEFIGKIKEEVKDEIEKYLVENFEGEEYKVCTEESRDVEVKEYIRETLWIFKTSFLMNYLRLDKNLSVHSLKRIEKSLEKMQGELCEDANEIIYAMIGEEDRFEDLVEDAVFSDGYGSFLAPYDHEEHEIIIGGEVFFMYRIN